MKDQKNRKNRGTGKISHAVGIERGTVWLHERKRGLTWGECVL